jgi:hypothetical protein
MTTTKLAMISVVKPDEVDLALNLLRSLQKFKIHPYHMSYVLDEASDDKIKSAGFNATLIREDGEGARPPAHILKYGIIGSLMKGFSHIWYMSPSSFVKGNVTAFFHHDCPKEEDAILQVTAGKLNPDCMLLRSKETLYALCHHMSTKVPHEADEAQVLTDILPRVEPRLDTSLLQDKAFPSASLFFGPSEAHDKYVEDGAQPLFVCTRGLGDGETCMRALKAKGLWLEEERESVAEKAQN